jgi:hypothetical protein
MKTGRALTWLETNSGTRLGVDDENEAHLGKHEQNVVLGVGCHCHGEAGSGCGSHLLRVLVRRLYRRHGVPCASDLADLDRAPSVRLVREREEIGLICWDCGEGIRVCRHRLADVALHGVQLELSREPVGPPGNAVEEAPLAVRGRLVVDDPRLCEGRVAVELLDRRGLA